jgi:probable HAF family extracellular repeat protein
MKTFCLDKIIRAALAVGLLALIIGDAEAQLPKKFSRSRSPERDGTAPAVRVVRQDQLPPLLAPAPPGYPRYRLVDLGTLGGDNAFTVLPAVTLNNRGENIAQASTDILDPYPFTIQDEFIWHGILRQPGGVVSDLGALAGVAQSLPVWISGNGFIAGMSENGLLDDTVDFPQLRPVFWDRARNPHDLGTFGGNTGFANAVNNRGQVAGYATNTIPEDPDVASFMNGFLPAGQQVRAFVWNGGSLRDLGTLGGNDAAAQAINECGDVGGLSYTDTEINDTTGLPTVHPFVWRNGTMHDLGSLGGTLSIPGSFAFGPFGKFLNNRGDLAGTSTLPGDETWHAFVWTGNQMIEIGTFGGDNSEAFFISDNGQVLGRAEVSLVPFVRHAFLWKNGRMIDLGAPAPCTRSSALGMNAAGQIVGDTGACTDDPNDPYYFSTFYVEKGKPAVDLNELITPASDIHLDDAGYINDRGEISGGGFAPDGSLHAVLLVPIPPIH